MSSTQCGGFLGFGTPTSALKTCSQRFIRPGGKVPRCETLPSSRPADLIPPPLKARTHLAVEGGGKSQKQGGRAMGVTLRSFEKVNPQKMSSLSWCNGGWFHGDESIPWNRIHRKNHKKKKQTKVVLGMSLLKEKSPTLFGTKSSKGSHLYWAIYYESLT